MTERLGPQRAMLAVVLAGALVTYGGVSLFVAFFVLAPMAQALFRAAGIPRRLMPAAIVLGTSTFTMSALPGTPSIQNAIPMPFFGTTPFAAPGLGIIASLIMLGFGLWWLNAAEARRGGAGEGFGDGATDAVRRGSPTTNSCASAPPPRASSIRQRSITASHRRRRRRLRGAAPRRRHRRQSRDVVVHPAATRLKLSRRSALGRDVACRCRRRVGRGHGARLRYRDRARGQPFGDCRRCARRMDAGANASVLPAFSVASLVGFGAVVAAMPAFAVVRDAVLGIGGGPLVSLAVATNVLAALTGSASGGLTIALDALGRDLHDASRRRSGSIPRCCIASR